MGGQILDYEAKEIYKSGMKEGSIQRIVDQITKNSSKEKQPSR